MQLELAKEQGLQEKQREYLWRISDSYDKAGYLDIAENHLKELLEQELSEEQNLEALCFLADIQVCCYTGMGLVHPSCRLCPPAPAAYNLLLRRPCVVWMCTWHGALLATAFLLAWCSLRLHRG